MSRGRRVSDIRSSIRIAFAVPGNLSVSEVGRKRCMRTSGLGLRSSTTVATVHRAIIAANDIISAQDRNNLGHIEDRGNLRGAELMYARRTRVTKLYRIIHEGDN